MHGKHFFIEGYCLELNRLKRSYKYSKQKNEEGVGGVYDILWERRRAGHSGCISGCFGLQRFAISAVLGFSGSCVAGNGSVVTITLSAVCSCCGTLQPSWSSLEAWQVEQPEAFFLPAPWQLSDFKAGTH